MLTETNVDKSQAVSACGAAALSLCGAVAGFLDRRFFLVGAITAVAMAYPLSRVLNEDTETVLDLAARWVSPVGIFLISGVTLPTHQLAAATQRVSAHLYIQGFNLLLMPAVTLLVVTPLRSASLLSPSAADGMLITLALPTTINMSIALTRIAGGNESLAVFNAVLGNLLGMIFTPLLVFAMLGQVRSVYGWFCTCWHARCAQAAPLYTRRAGVEGVLRAAPPPDSVTFRCFRLDLHTESRDGGGVPRAAPQNKYGR